MTSNGQHGGVSMHVQLYARSDRPGLQAHGRDLLPWAVTSTDQCPYAKPARNMCCLGVSHIQ